jgi:ribose transport system substrate-binding protein|nr:substrate-binding domain-containing protein [uncultured Anaerocolumna sp.]
MKKMKKVFVVILCMIFAFNLVACSGKNDSKGTGTNGTDGNTESDGKGSEKGIKVGVSAPDLTNVFFIQIKEAMEAALGPNDELIIQDAAGDQNKQMNDVADMINQGVDVIAISAINSEGVEATLRACQEAGVPVIAFNTAVKNSELVKSTVVSDNYLAGQLCAQALADALDGKGNVVEITYSTTEVCYNRQAGFEDELKKYPEIKILQSRDVEKARADFSQPVMVDLINANPDIDGVFTINDPTARGAIAALKEAGMLEDVKVVAIDGSDEGKDFIRAGEMVASAAQNPEKIGSTVVETAKKIIAGEQVEEKIIIEMSIITKDNIDK